VIASLRGRLAQVGEDHLVIDVGGVGYLVQAGARTLQALPRPGETVELAIETQVREDAITLYGFLDPAERVWFRTLQGIQGVGARVALGVLSVLDAAGLARAIAAQDKAMLVRAPGVGAKLAARIVMELKDKAPGLPLPASAMPAVAVQVGDDSEDAVSALLNLGYGRSEAHQAVQAALGRHGGKAPVATLIRDALQALAR
jgi:Holliday junction DNA helicase RuvA